VILAMTAQRFRVAIDPSRPVKLVLYVSLMAHTLWVRMESRKPMPHAGGVHSGRGTAAAV
jgi:hypothetical protein